MLKTTHSSDTSPSSFRYGLARSPLAPTPRDITNTLRATSSRLAASGGSVISPVDCDPNQSDAGAATVQMSQDQQSAPATANANDSVVAEEQQRQSPSSAESASVAMAVAVAENMDVQLSPIKRRGAGSENGSISDPTTQEVAQPRSRSRSPKRQRADEQPPKALPIKYENCPVEDMVELIAHMLGELIATNDSIRTASGGLTRFHSRTAPGISVHDYLDRLAKHATLTPPLLLVMVYYIDRLCAMYPEFTINTLTVHRFLITAATVAAKGLSDLFWNNTTYALVGGVRLAELKLLELEFLYRVDWKIVPNPEVLVAYYRGLIERTPGYVLEAETSDPSVVDIDNDTTENPTQ